MYTNVYEKKKLFTNIYCSVPTLDKVDPKDRKGKIFLIP